VSSFVKYITINIYKYITFLVGRPKDVGPEMLFANITETPETVDPGFFLDAVGHMSQLPLSYPATSVLCTILYRKLRTAQLRKHQQLMMALFFP